MKQELLLIVRNNISGTPLVSNYYRERIADFAVVLLSHCNTADLL